MVIVRFSVVLFEVVMSISDQTADAAIALHQRIAFLESQIAELSVLRNRLAQAELRRFRSRSDRSASRRTKPTPKM
jgi:hypothetical protein